MMAIGIAIERFHVFKHIRLDAFSDQKSLELELTKKIHLIATIGSNAPYIGLLGTVLGIMLTFYMIGQEGFMDTGKIMVGLALALKATVVGLLVAIPSVSLYNFLIGKVKVLRNISYPDSARRMGWQGKILLSFIISADGSVREIKIIQGSGFPILDKSAVETVKDTAPFPKPPVEAQLVIPIIFRLKS
jgi:biopolymer transport protein ExbB